MKTIELQNAMIHISDDAPSLVRDLADHFCQLATSVIAGERRFAVALSGGSTPKPLYQLLATPEYASRVDWAKTLIFLVDERCVPHHHSDSNYKMIRETLLASGRIPEKNIFPTHNQDTDPQRAALQYERTMQEVFSIDATALPQFDLMIMGLGPDGHTASLFPGSKALDEQHRLCVANRVEKLDSWRITVTYPVINNADNIVFIVSGANKADMVNEIFTTHDRYPAQGVQPKHGRLEWYLDKAAAAQLGG